MSSSARSASADGLDEVARPSERPHASDGVFRAIASAILVGEVEPGAALPPERELSMRFNVSRIVAREAVHRLEQYGLVRVRQGAVTRVLDPTEGMGPTQLAVELELTRDLDSLLEWQMYCGAAVVAIAEQRMGEGEITALERLVDDYLEDLENDRQWVDFERDFWMALGRGTGNRLLLRDVTWFFTRLARRSALHDGPKQAQRHRALWYRAVVKKLRERSGAASLYLHFLRSVPSSPAPAPSNTSM